MAIPIAAPPARHRGAGPFPLVAPVAQSTQAGVARRHYQGEAVGSDGGGPLMRTADIRRSSSHTDRYHIHRQA